MNAELLCMMMMLGNKMMIAAFWCSFTLEASFAGPDAGALAGSHYDTAQLESIGANLALALLDYSDPHKAAQAAADLRKVAQQQQEQPALFVQGLQCDVESNGSMSDGAAAVSQTAFCSASLCGIRLSLDLACITNTAAMLHSQAFTLQLHCPLMLPSS